MASTRITRTLSANGDKKLTISAWIKRGNISVAQYICRVFSDGNNQGGLYFTSGDNIEWFDYVGGAYKLRYITNAVYRDTSAWYHILAHFDNSLGSPEAKLYVNGVEQSLSTSTNYTQNQTTSWNNNYTFDIGSAATGTYFDGSMTHFYFIQNQKYAPTTFGETDSTSGIWKPITSPTIDYSATGSNSCLLKFENSGNMDLDSGSNNVSFTTSGNLTQNVDTPSNNFNTLNGIGVRASNFTLSNGNSSATCGADWETLEGTLGVNKGKWYYEAKWNGSNYFMAGWTSTNFMSKVPTSYVGHTITEPSYALGLNDAKVYYSTSSSATQDSAVWGNTLTSSDILGCAIDIDNGKLYWSKNGVWMNSGDPTSGATGTGAYSITDTATNYFWQPVMGCYNSAGNFNFGQGYFGTTAVASANADDGGLGIMEYDVPANYRVLCTKNIKDYG